MMMIHPENPLQAFDSLLSRADESGSVFFAYRLPNLQEIVVATGCIIKHSDLSAGDDAFIIAPFSPEKGYDIIRPQVCISTPVSKANQLPKLKTDDSITPTKEYTDSIEQLINGLKSRGGKTVFSRIIDASTNSELSIAHLFHSLCSRYPQSYVYCWKKPNENLWIGAVPELLLESRGSKLNTMSLAGTQPIDSTTRWDLKNLEEQRIVTEYLKKLFSSRGMNPSTEGPNDKPAGPVKHLCTSVSAFKPSQQFDILSFARILAPTPAVCGMPVNDALADIMRLEQHDRKYYGGYSGPIKGDNACNLFVTLRCMEINGNVSNSSETSTHVRLYVGGGITAQSQANTEWTETRLKASTLTDLFS